MNFPPIISTDRMVRMHACLLSYTPVVTDQIAEINLEQGLQK